MRSALGNSIDTKDREELRKADTQQLVRLATAHSIANFIPRAFEHGQIADCLDPEVMGFFRHLREQNRERNKRLADQLTEASNLLQRDGIPTIALKGATEFVTPIYDDPADRILSDLDVLVPEDRIDEAINILKSNGYTDDDLAYDRTMRHAPALWRAGELTAIELHTAASASPALGILPPQELFQNAVSGLDPALRAPAPVDRICHLVSHAQIDSGRYSSNLVLLRDVADYARMFAKFGKDGILEASARFDEAELSQYFQSFIELSCNVLEAENPIDSTSVEAENWVQTTLDLTAEPGRHRLAMLASIFAWIWGRLSSGPAARRQFLSGLLSPMRIRQFLSRNLAAIKGLQ